ncbi:MAG: hypothetical protein H6751_01045 [Candidatus Omnitrophica bacterium]|nr:hypothetical protein [Candidatus Omnitrophota bacterium]
MSDRILQFLFDPDLSEELEPSGRTVICFQQASDQDLGGESLKSFCGDSYADLGHEIGLWWFRLFSTEGGEARTLHHLFEREGVSALWFTRNLFLYEDFGVLPRLLVTIRALELFEKGEFEKVRVVGGPSCLEKVFQVAGIPCEWMPPKRSETTSHSLIDRLKRNFRGLNRRFLQSHKLRRKHSENHRPGQTDTLLYSVIQGEWTPGGGHRYLEETVQELLELGEANSARPFVYGVPSVLDDESDWREFLEYSLDSKGGVYPMSYATLSEFREIRSWVSQRMAALREWLQKAPDGWARFRDWDLLPLINGEISDLGSQLERGLLMHLASRKAFDEIRPKGLLLKDEVYPHGRILIAAARASGVRTFSLQHGSIYPTHWCYLMDPEAEGLARPPLPDVFGVYGSAIADLLANRNGFPSEILRVVGARRFQELDRMRPSQEFVDLKAEGKPLVLVAGQLHQDMPKVYSWLFTLAEQNPNLNFVFKPHPRDKEGVDSIQSRCTRLGNARMFVGPIGDILPTVDLVVSCHSTVLLEAVWLGIGGISVLVSGEPAADWQERSGLLKIARSQEELTAAFEALSKGELFSHEARETSKTYLEEYLGYSKVGDPGTLKGILQPAAP